MARKGVIDMTNAELFKKVFGFTPESCPMPAKVCKSHNGTCFKCPFYKWWDRQYLPCFELKEELDGGEDDGSD